MSIDNFDSSSATCKSSTEYDISRIHLTTGYMTNINGEILKMSDTPILNEAGCYGWGEEEELFKKLNDEKALDFFNSKPKDDETKYENIIYSSYEVCRGNGVCTCGSEGTGMCQC